MRHADRVVAYSSADLDAIRETIARGELEVQFVDRRVRYRSMSELVEAENRIARALASPRHKQHLAYAQKGFTSCG